MIEDNCCDSYDHMETRLDYRKHCPNIHEVMKSPCRNYRKQEHYKRSNGQVILKGWYDANTTMAVEMDITAAKI